MGNDELINFTTKYPAKKLKENEMLLYSDDKPDAVYYLKSGYVKQYVISDEGRELTVHIYEAGALFPINWVINDKETGINLQAITECELKMIPKEDVLKLLKRKPEVLMGITKRLSSGLDGLSKRIQIVCFNSAEERVFETLKYLRKHFGEEFKFSHEDISSLTGLSRERVSIEMKKFKDDNLVFYKHGKITFKLDR